MSYSVWDAITRSHRLGGLKKINLFFKVLEPGKFKIRAPADLVSGENSPTSFQMSEIGSSKLFLFLKGTNPITGVILS